MDFKGMNILVLGAGISGISAAQVLAGEGATVTLSDGRSAQELGRDFSSLKRLGVRLALGNQDQTLLEGTDCVVLSPGVSIYSPLVEAARSREILVISEIEVAYNLCKAPIIAVTGTNGKTTTTTLIGEMVKAAGIETVVGGNIGLALSHEVRSVSENGLVVAEISSFQLEGIMNFRAHIAAVLNVTPDHIDRHRTLENYVLMKERVFENQTARDYVILNYDDTAVRQMADRASSRIVFFSRLSQLSQGVYVRDGEIVISWEGSTTKLCPVSAIRIKGAHNVENALAACAAAYFAGVSPSVMEKVLREFSGVEHRIEPVATINGVEYFNDSKATNPESSIKALEAFPSHIILIAGGRDKNTDLTEFMRLIRDRVDHLILLGEAAARFRAEAEKNNVTHIHDVNSMEEAVSLAHAIARPGQVVLLSPACASYDMFNNYEERGRFFKDLVRRL